MGLKLQHLLAPKILLYVNVEGHRLKFALFTKKIIFIFVSYRLKAYIFTFEAWLACNSSKRSYIVFQVPTSFLPHPSSRLAVSALYFSTYCISNTKILSSFQH